MSAVGVGNGAKNVLVGSGGSGVSAAVGAGVAEAAGVSEVMAGVPITLELPGRTNKNKTPHATPAISSHAR